MDFDEPMNFGKVDEIDIDEARVMDEEDVSFNLKKELLKYELFETIFDDEKLQHDKFIAKFKFSPT